MDIQIFESNRRRLEKSNWTKYPEVNFWFGGITVKGPPDLEMWRSRF